MGAWADAKKIIEQTEREADERRGRTPGRTPAGTPDRPPDNDEAAGRGDAPGGMADGEAGGRRRPKPCAAPAARGGERLPAGAVGRVRH